MSDSIQVAIKVRPLIKREKDENLPIQWAVVENAIVPTDPEKKRGESSFQFDHIFGPENNNSDVFNTVVQPIVDAAVKGFNGTIFAYGQTSSGKTYTMMGIPSEPGVIPMAIERIFDSIANTNGREFLLRVSYLEIYNEKVNDLLNTDGVDLKLREDNNGLVYVLNCKEEIASNPETILNSMKRGDKNRRIGETEMNEKSSRSHSIFRIVIESREVTSDSDGAIQVSQLNLVDLAGSERARQTNATGERFKEGTHINMSLSTLGLVIKQLSEADKNNTFVNFRDSKLTRLLQASLGGNAMTTIICAVTPAAFEETQCTLGFASRAKSVKNKPQLNEVMSDAALLKRYKKQIAKLNEELEKVKHENRIAEVQEMESKLLEKEHKLQETDRINQLLEERIELLKNSIICAGSSMREEPSHIPKTRRRRTWAGNGGSHTRYSPRTLNLPPIQELTSDSTTEVVGNFRSFKGRKSIIQSMDFCNESFERFPFADFEMDLIKDSKEQEKLLDMDFYEEKSHQRSKLKSDNRVKFQEDVEIYRLSAGSNWSEYSTPEKLKSRHDEDDEIRPPSASPGTPKEVLRERLNYVTEEFNTLREFTTLEKQLFSVHTTSFESPSEKIYFLNRVDELIAKYIENQSVENTKDGADFIQELEILREYLVVPSEELNIEDDGLTLLEKQLTNDFNKCIQELELIRSERDQFENENLEMRKKLLDESNRLKSAEEVIKRLSGDTDCLMEKVLLKDKELANLREKVVQLEDLCKKMESHVLDVELQSDAENVNEPPSSSVTNQSQEKDSEISRLREVLAENVREIEKLKKYEKTVELENEKLEQNFGAISKVEQISVECQTDEISCSSTQDTPKLLPNTTQGDEISKLTDVIQNQNALISNHQKTEMDMQEKIESLQQQLDLLTRIESTSIERETEITDCKNNSSSIQDQEESQQSSHVSQEEIYELLNLNPGENSLKEKLKFLKETESLGEVQTNSVLTQAEFLHAAEEGVSLETYLKKDEHICRLQTIILEKDLAIEDSRKAIEELQTQLQKVLGSDKSQSQETDNVHCRNFLDRSMMTEAINDTCHDKNELLQMIQSQSEQIKEYENSHRAMQEEIENLQNIIQSLGNKDLEQQRHSYEEEYHDALEEDICVEKKSGLRDSCQSGREVEEKMEKLVQPLHEEEIACSSVVESSSQERTQNDLDIDGVDDVQRLTEIIQEKDLQIEKLLSEKFELDKQVESLKQNFKETIGTALIPGKTPTDSITRDNAENNPALEPEVVDENCVPSNVTQSGENDPLEFSVEETIGLRVTENLLNFTPDVEHLDQQKEHETDERRTSTVNEPSFTETTGNQTAKDAELESQTVPLDGDIATKIQYAEEILSSNVALKKLVDEKTNEISNLQICCETRVQELEDKINSLIIERAELKEKIASVISSDRAQNYENESANLQMSMDKLVRENKELKERISKLCANHDTTSDTPANEEELESCAVQVNLDPITNAEHNPVANNLIKSEQTSKIDETVALQQCDISSTEDHSFVHPNAIKKDSRPSSPAAATVASNKAIVRPFKSIELESSSIFANATYFDNMEVGQSFIQDSVTWKGLEDESKNMSNISLANNNSLVKSMIEEGVDVNETVIDNAPSSKQIDDMNKSKVMSPATSRSVRRVSSSPGDSNKVRTLERENAKLKYDLQAKINETEEVQRVLCEFKNSLEELQQTVYILTNENMDVSKHLEDARQRHSEELRDLQTEIDSLTNRLSIISEEKENLKSELVLVTEQLENMRSTTPVVTEEETKQKFADYQEKINKLNDENIELSTNLMDKIEELERIKESQIILYDHQCVYKENCESLSEKIHCLEKENVDLSNNLTEQLEECDKLHETVNVLKQQLEAHDNQQSCETEQKNDLQFLKDENSRLTEELIEVRAKVTQLSRENANLSINLDLDSSGEHNVSVASRENAFNISKSTPENSLHDSTVDTINLSCLKKENKSLKDQVEHLTMLNKKLGELKLNNCNQCAHLKELNESRRQLKLEVKSLSHKLCDLQKEFQQKCADTEILRSKANEDVNASLSLMESTLNGTLYDGINVTAVEEKVHNLYSEVEDLKENHNKLSNQYQEKCRELEKLQLENNALSSPTDKRDVRRSKDSSSRKSSRILTLEKNLDKLSIDLQELKKSNTNVGAALNKFITEKNEYTKEIESLKALNDILKKDYNAVQGLVMEREEKTKLLEEELSSLYKKYEDANNQHKDIQSQKIEIEVQLETLLKDKLELEDRIQHIENKSKQDLEECKALLQNYETKNLDLRDKLKDYDTIGHPKVLKDTNSCSSDDAAEEVKLVKSRILKEIRSLTNLSEDEQKNLPRKSGADLFETCLKVVMSKETEMVKKLVADFNKSKQKLEEEKRQSLDAEKKANDWAKTIEGDLEKLQNDFAEQERKNRKLQDQIHRLEDRLKESIYENQQLHSSVANLESDLNSLHNELEKKSKMETNKESIISAAQEREKVMRQRDEEWENRLKMEKEQYLREVNELNTQLQSMRCSEEDLKSTVECLEFEIEHLKNTIESKTYDYGELSHKCETLERNMKDAEDASQTLENEISDKNRSIKELNELLKIKCDLLTEYKTQVENMKPEHDFMQAQIAERKMMIEKYKEEIHNLKLENKRQLDILHDKLSDEEIKNTGLNKQLIEFKNKNTHLSDTIEELRDRVAEIERDNERLQKKVRNSTSKVRVENEMQELQDENRTLKNQLEGSYNRIKELQEMNSQVKLQLSESTVANEILKQDLDTTERALSSLREKYNNMNLQNLREKYETLLSEKNSMALDIDEKKMVIANNNQKLVEYSIEIDTLRRERELLDKEMKNAKNEKCMLENRVSELIRNNEKIKEQIEVLDVQKDEEYKRLNHEKNVLSLELKECMEEKSELVKKNKELDAEMEELVDHIHKQDDEIAELQDRIITGTFNKGHMDKLKTLEDEHEKLKIDYRSLEFNRTKLENEILRLNSEKEIFLSKIEALNGKVGELESKYSSRSSSKSNSPTSRNGRRRQRRSDVYNQNRNLDDSDCKDVTDTESPSMTPTPPPFVRIPEECQTCKDFRKRMNEMTLDLISKNRKITLLEDQLKSQNFPYQIKCNELQEKLSSMKSKNSEFKLEIGKLQRALQEDSSRECRVCRQRKLNSRDQSVQVNRENKAYLSGMSSGIVEDHLRLQKMERERNLMKELCRSRAKTIRDLQNRIDELEGSRATLKTS
ncbi:hypothetical protein QAD02_011792 [Eretmocerus hayati]|uniref:Uncharacterized protein n=1 Tax=Eretmocerus hayati TaxID=131215 RepID=A0ACC2NYZ5_9HYME|nr:hypothetical protein QAD02_011792 [Eretmocerus hayati]